MTEKEVGTFYTNLHPLLLADEKIPFLDFLSSLHRNVFGRLDGKRFLDVGCGTGVHSIVLTGLGGIGKAVDLNEDILLIARENMSKHGVSSSAVELRCGNALDLAFDAEEFDAVTCLYMSQHTGNPERCLTECLRVLKPGGTLLFSFTAENFISALDERIRFLSKTPAVLQHLIGLIIAVPYRFCTLFAPGRVVGTPALLDVMDFLFVPVRKHISAERVFDLLKRGGMTFEVLKRTGLMVNMTILKIVKPSR